MIKEILTDSGFVEGKTFKETRFVKPPKETYAVYLDSCNVRGADGHNLITEHDYSIELYSDIPDSDAEERVEKSLDKFGLEYEKSERFWIQSEQLYQRIYNFNFIEK